MLLSFFVPQQQQQQQEEVVAMSPSGSHSNYVSIPFLFQSRFSSRRFVAEFCFGAFWCLIFFSADWCVVGLFPGVPAWFLL